MLAACWFAVLKAGGIAVTTMPLLRARELATIIDKAQITLALCDARLADELRAARAPAPVCARVCTFDGSGRPGAGAELERRMAAPRPSFANVDTAADDVALIAFTSGTTGRPKGTMHFHRDVLAICDCFPRSCCKPGADDVFIGTPPLGFTFGLGGSGHFPMRVGASAVLLEAAPPEQLLQAIAAVPREHLLHRADRLPDDAGQGRRVRSRRACASASRPARPCRWRPSRRGRRRPASRSSTASAPPRCCTSSSRPPAMRSGRARPAGRSRATRRWWSTTQMRPLPPGAVGRLAVRGPTGCRYLADERQRDYVRDGWNITGDAYLVDEDGYFRYQARTDDMIISAGYNIAGPEVEDALLEHPAVAECAVVGVPDEERGQIVKAFVVLRQGVAGDGPPARGAAGASSRQRIAAYKYPRAIEFVDALPRTETGKLQRFRLRQSEARHPARGMSGHADPAAARLAAPARLRQRHRGARHAWSSSPARSAGTSARPSCPTISPRSSRQALDNTLAVLREAGAGPEHVVRMTWYVTDKRDYLARARELGEVYRARMGRHYPAMAVVEVSALIEERARVEIETTAVIPDPRPPAAR